MIIKKTDIVNLRLPPRKSGYTETGKPKRNPLNTMFVKVTSLILNLPKFNPLLYTYCMVLWLIPGKKCTIWLIKQAATEQEHNGKIGFTIELTIEFQKGDGVLQRR